MASIVRPSDWETVPFNRFGVVVTGLGSGVYCCTLMNAKEYFGGSAQYSKIISECQLERHDEDLWLGTFMDTQARGACMLAVRDESTGEFLHVQGIVLSPSTITCVRNRNSESNIRAVSYPLPVIRTSLSNFDVPYARTIEVPTVNSEADLRRSGANIAQRVAYGAVDHDAKSSMILDYCVNADNAAFREQLRTSSWRSGAISFTSFSEVTVYLRTGAVVLADGIWLDSAFAGMLRDQTLANYPDMFTHDGRYGRLDTGRGVAGLSDRPMFLLSNAGLGNFSHWMMNGLFTAFLLKDALRHSNGVLLAPRIPFFARESLRLLGLEDHLLESELTILECKDLVFASPLSTHSNMYPSDQIAAMVAALKQGAQANPIFDRFDKPAFIYMTRRGFGSGRQMTNEDEFIAQLDDLGFVTIATHELSMIEKIAVFSEAKIIISQMGAGLTHMMFAPAGCVVVEITTERFHSNEFWYLASLLGLSYARFMIPETDGKYVDTLSFEFEVPVERAVGVIRNIQADLG